MLFPSPLLEGTLEKRYKRFLAEVRLLDGRLETVYCPNTGSMKSCSLPGSRVWVSDSGDVSRKYPLTWELIQVEDYLVSINTARPNLLVEEAIINGKIPSLLGYHYLSREVKYGQNSRVDLLLKFKNQDCYIEVKNVTLGIKGKGFFPDAVTKRGQKHLKELEAMIESGKRSLLIFCVQNPGIQSVSPADHIDPVYGSLLRQAMARGLEVLAYSAEVQLTGICLSKEIPVVV